MMRLVVAKPREEFSPEPPVLSYKKPVFYKVPAGIKNASERA
jgi:hypothetical protein